MAPSLEVTTDRRAVATITLDRPAVRNALNDHVIAELTATLQRLDADPGVRAVVLAGNGPAFSAGGDLPWMKRMGESGEAENLADTAAICHMLRTLNELGKPTVARVHGAAYAAGTGLVAACDIAIASDEAMFSISEVRIGLVPSTISPYVIAAIGSRAARRYFLTGEAFTAAEACRLGLVHRVVALPALDETIDGILSALLQAAPRAQVLAKRLIRTIADRPIDEEIIALTARSMADARASAEGQRGMTAFMEKRRPDWTS